MMIFSGFPWFIREANETQEEYEKRCKKIWEYTFSKKGLKKTAKDLRKLAKEMSKKIKKGEFE